MPPGSFPTMFKRLVAAISILVAATAVSCSSGPEETAETAPTEEPKPLCPKRDLDRCFVLGLMLESGYEGKPDPARAAEYYEFACARAHDDACYNLAVLEVEGRGVERDPAQARRRYQRMCAAGHGPSCANLGFLVSTGDGGDAAPEDALALYERACELGSPVGCANYGDRLIASDVVDERKKAVAAFANACRQGNQSGCFIHGWALANDCIEKVCSFEDTSALAKSVETRCQPEGTPRVCATFAAHLMGGQHHEPDPLKARKLARSACDAGDGWACTLHGAAAIRGSGGGVDHEGAHRSFMRGCEARHAPACTQGGVQMVEGRGIPRDQTGGYAALGMGCSLGDVDACNTLLLFCQQGDEAACMARADD